MKYMILAYGSQQDYDSLAGKDGAQPAASAEELAATGEFLTKFTGEPAASGELVDTQGLTTPVLARKVQLRDGVPVATDGPFAETEEVVAGCWIVDCAGFDRAADIAVRLNQAPAQMPEWRMSVLQAALFVTIPIAITALPLSPAARRDFE